MISESTAYRYVDQSLFSARNLDLPRKIRYSARKIKKHYKVDKQCRTGRTYVDFQKDVEGHPDTPVTELDSVEGKKGCIFSPAASRPIT